ncbi:DNA repair helicase [Aurantimicrobium sp. INA4]|uniref:DEAD/DEAH box helicase n=1 Tax=Aurantimicrobium sp. INA4 TaxID=2986279 RepID=UPI002491C752|nr:DEAD/DEAH box helicase [Aurantimicrobium sp. INA4]BDU10323.1 DNA repair helicase [Aurantimicrobium sp. INA4]
MDLYQWEDIGRNGDYVGPELRQWQKEALWHWGENSNRGVVEAITGTGKSLVGVAAIRQVLAEGGCALVLVPTSALLEQWHRNLEKALPRARVGKLTGGRHDDFNSYNVLVSTVQTACKNQPKPKSLALLVADEAHRYGSSQFSFALNSSYNRRLALSGTYERQQDDGVEKYLNPFFDGVIYNYGYGPALRDDVVAPFNLALVATEFTPHEKHEYDLETEKCRKAKRYLVKNCFYPDDWPEFFAQVQTKIKDHSRDTESYFCRQYVEGFAHRRSIMAEASGKEGFLVGIRDSLDKSSGTLIFTETKESARRLAWIASQATTAMPLTGDDKHLEREARLKEFGSGKLKVICTPRILDEGIDVPEAEIAIVIAASKSKRQMIQRMGRVIRKKSPPRAAKILITYVKGTSEDPIDGGGHEGFLAEVEEHAHGDVAYFRAQDVLELSEWLSADSSIGSG